MVGGGGNGYQSWMVGDDRRWWSIVVDNEWVGDGIWQLQVGGRWIAGGGGGVYRWW